MGKHNLAQQHHTGRNIAIVGTGALSIIGYGGLANAQPAQHDWSGVAQCESSGNWNINTGNGFYGGLQFTDSTWDAYKPAGAPDRADQASVEQQVAAAEATLAVQGVGAWPVCGQFLALSSTQTNETPDPGMVAPAEAPVVSQGNSGCDRMWPVDGPITSGYGGREGGFHDGTDFGVPVGTPVHAATSGTVSVSGIGNDPGGYGNYIQQEADDGTSIQYGHISETYVAPGEYVEVGDIIAASGNAGSSTGPHLHLRTSSGDPIGYLAGACDTGEAPVSDTPIADETQAAIETQAAVQDEPAPIFDSLWNDLYQNNIEVVGNDPDLIYPGQVLDIDGDNGDATYEVVAGDTLSGISVRFG